MTTMSVEQAETLYTILDKHVGMFSFEGMNQKAQEFCKKKRLEFVNLFSVVGIPDLYWFQGVKCAPQRILSTTLSETSSRWSQRSTAKMSGRPLRR